MAALITLLAVLEQENAEMRRLAEDALAQADRYFRLWYHLSHGVLPPDERLPSIQARRQEEADAGCRL
jgi:hypothetical protein